MFTSVLGVAPLLAWLPPPPLTSSFSTSIYHFSRSPRLLGGASAAVIFPFSYCCAPSRFTHPLSAAATATLRDVCEGRVPDHILDRAEELGFVRATEVQRQSLPVLLLGRDCVLHAQTGSGKTLAYLFAIFSAIDFGKASVQAIIVVPNRELGMQVSKVSRALSGKPQGLDMVQKTCIVMSLLDGGMLRRHKSWLKAEPPQIIVATVMSLCQMLEKHVFNLESVRILVIDEVDFMFNSSKQVYSLRKLLTSYSSTESRQTILASASIPQHNRFLYDCAQQKWTKKDVVHIHVNPIEPIPTHLCHTFMVCDKGKLHALSYLLQRDAPKSAIIFVAEQSEKSKKAGKPPSTTVVFEFLKTYFGCYEVVLLDEDMNFNARAASFSNVRQGGNCLLVATDIASRGFDLRETTHIYNFDLPKTAVGYLHRAGRTGRLPFSNEACSVTSLISQNERFVLQRFENELKFHCEDIGSLSSCTQTIPPKIHMMY